METAIKPRNQHRRRSRPALNEVTVGQQTADGEFILKPKQIEYLVAFMSAVCEGKPRHDAELSRVIGVELIGP